MTFYEFNERFPTEDAAIEYFLRTRYNNTLVCPHCGSKVKVYHRKDRKRICNCYNCNNTFSIFTNTIFEKSTTDLRKWFYAIHLFLNDKKGISGCQLQREIGTTYKTAWHILQKIRTAMANDLAKKSFEFFVEIDETYVGGKPRKENVKLDHNDNIIPSNKPKSKRGRGTSKTPVVGIKERNTKRVYAQVALPNADGQSLTGNQLLAILDKVVADGTTVISDDFRGYNILDKEHKNNFIHLSVNHSLGQYTNKEIHTNNIENFWSILKRSIVGTYHHVSKKYLQKYIDECVFRQNHRKNTRAFNILLKQCVDA